MNGFARDYEFIGHTGDVTVETDLLSMLLNMHDYNHQNGTHRSLFTINSVEFQSFQDEGLHSHAYYNMPRSQPSFKEVLSNPAVLAMPQTIEAHLENFFPSLVIFHGATAIGIVKQVHLFIPESLTRTRTYVLMFGKPLSPVFRLARQNILNLAKTVVEQDADILGKIYAGHSQKIKLNNEVGMNWVRRNFESFPEVVGPNLSR
ncbi:MAG: Rieske (2Fe-2S) protein [Alkalinema sp. RU_4_3]|nr:Rieske (2Fe-2S) protein [Alkalinema sp. RU_4_3]